MIGPDGAIVMNEGSMVVEASQPTLEESTVDGNFIHEEDSDVNYFSFKKDYGRGRRWSMKGPLNIHNLSFLLYI